MNLFNDHFTFLKTALGTELSDIIGRQAEFKEVDIPHDWLIYNAQNLYENSTGWYRKAFRKADIGIGEGEGAYIRFDGVYMDCTVYINHVKVGDWKYGYSAFGFDISPYLQEENVILVQVRHQSPGSRWYSGAGIYRNVWLKVLGKAYLPMDGTYVSTKYVEDGIYSLEVSSEIAGEQAKECSCSYILYREGKCIKEFTDGSVTVTGVQEWDIDCPVCYTLEVRLVHNKTGKLMDTEQVTIGFRRVEFSSETGFWLNGKNRKLNGVCEHHDLGALGAAFHVGAMRRKLEILRGMGVNAIRTSHNMPAKELMELADEMGFLVVSEAFDMWKRSKTPYDYARFFEEWAEKDVESWVRRDRNHPSLIMWSIGNEIYDTHADADAPETVQRLIDAVRIHDPKGNGAITIGSNFMPWEGAQRCADMVKLAGYNYGENYYPAHHEKYSDWVIYGSETASLVQSRGVYRFPLEQSMLADEDEQCSAIGNSSTSWGARSVEKCITIDRDYPFSMGQFLWTGFDYIGEPTPYHTKNSYFGHVDTAGFPKDSYYVYAAAWTPLEKECILHLYPHWDFNPGQIVDVRVASNAPRVELFVNGISKGIREIDVLHGEDIQGTWKVAYEPGEIVAVAYDENGKQLKSVARHSFGDGASLTLECDKTSLKADGEDMCFITISEMDKCGYPVENAMDYVEITLEGPGRLLGMDNGDSTDFDDYKSNVRKLFNGRLLAIVANAGEPGEIKVTARAKHLKHAILAIPVAEGEVTDGRSYGESVVCNATYPENIPVRKVEILTEEGQLLTKEKPALMVSAKVYPAYATDQAVIWKVVNTGGIEIPFAKVEPLSESTARVTALGDGEFILRCMSMSGTGKVKIISQLEFKAQGLGTAMHNPYTFVSAGLYTETFGKVTNGNEKGIATDRVDPSGVYFTNIDFGDYGSDEITMPIFALDSERHEIEMWLGRPEEGRLIAVLPYQKPSLWNVYQEETWTLPERLAGVCEISFRMHEKVHMKGFSFKKYDKAFCKLYGSDCSHVYGDDFVVDAPCITGIGNNVTIEFDDMDFGEGSCGVKLWGRSRLAGNTIHVLFTSRDGILQRRVLEVPGTEAYEMQQFSFEKLVGKGKVQLVFLPGSSFDFQAMEFTPFYV